MRRVCYENITYYAGGLVFGWVWYCGNISFMDGMKIKTNPFGCVK